MLGVPRLCAFPLCGCLSAEEVGRKLISYFFFFCSPSVVTAPLRTRACADFSFSFGEFLVAGGARVIAGEGWIHGCSAIKKLQSLFSTRVDGTAFLSSPARSLFSPRSVLPPFCYFHFFFRRGTCPPHLGTSCDCCSGARCSLYLVFVECLESCERFLRHAVPFEAVNV